LRIFNNLFKLFLSVGCGKTALIFSLFGEMIYKKDDEIKPQIIFKGKKISYVP